MALSSRFAAAACALIALAPALHAQTAPRLVAEPAGAASPASPPFVAGITYAYDDGAANVNIGPPSTFDPDMLWGNYFVTEPGGALITEIQVAFGSTFPSRAGGVTFWLLDDPDADFDPRNATALTSVTAVPDVSGNDFFVVPIPPTGVSGAFFVGASAQLLGGQDRPARVDTGARADRSWFFYAPDIAATIDSLGTAPFGTRMDDPTNVPFPGAFMVRAVGAPLVNASGSVPDAAPRLHAPVPNPSADRATVRFTLADVLPVTLAVYDAVGRQVVTLADGEHGPGTHAATWDTRGAAAGVYVVRLTAGATVQATRLVVTR